MLEVVKSVIQKGDKYLLLKRGTAAKFFSGLWDFPGGKLRPGEDPLVGAKREAYEETALSIEPDKLIEDFNYTETGTVIHFQVFSIKDYSGEVKLSQEHTDYKWLAREELSNYALAPVVNRLLLR